MRSKKGEKKTTNLYSLWFHPLLSIKNNNNNNKEIQQATLSLINRRVQCKSLVVTKSRKLINLFLKSNNDDEYLKYETLFRKSRKIKAKIIHFWLEIDELSQKKTWFHFSRAARSKKPESFLNLIDCMEASAKS